ncbi:MAG: response regulator transcription factor [Planctomycetota bacterium]
MVTRTPTVFVVDDDQALCESLQWLLESVGLAVRTFPSAEQFLAAYDPADPGCLVLDIRMPGMNGLDLQNRLGGRGITLPVIVITGHGDVPLAVRALRAGAVDFLEKPVHDQLLLQRIRAALERDAATRREQERRSGTAARLAHLTPREREVLELVVAGRANKQIAAELGVTQKTVEVHRKRVMQKMGVRSAVALTRLILEQRPPPTG